MTDPLPATVLESIRDRVAGLVVRRMEIRLDSEGCVPWTRKARLLREGIEIVGRFRSREFVPWHQITNVGAQDDTFCIFGEDSARPLGAVRAYETNALPGTYLVLKRIGTQLDRPIAETAPEIPAGCLPCPTCREPTDSLKQYEFYWITLFFGHFSTRRERFAGCPRCMRRYLVFWGLASLVTSNLFWPFAVVPKLLPRFVATFRRGRSVATNSLGWVLARDLAQMGVMGSVVFGVVSGLFLTLAPPEGWLMTLLFGASLASLAVFIGIGAAADV